MILVEHGANVLLVDDFGFTPVDVANGNNVQLLLKGNCKILETLKNQIPEKYNKKFGVLNGGLR